METLTIQNGSVREKKNKKINFAVAESFAFRLFSTAKEYKLNSSDFIRQACLRYMEELEKRKEEAELIEACKNNREFNKKFASEWSQYENQI